MFLVYSACRQAFVWEQFSLLTLCIVFSRCSFSIRSSPTCIIEKHSSAQHALSSKILDFFPQRSRSEKTTPNLQHRELWSSVECTSWRTDPNLRSFQTQTTKGVHYVVSMTGKTEIVHEIITHLIEGYVKLFQKPQIFLLTCPDQTGSHVTQCNPLKSSDPSRNHVFVHLLSLVCASRSNLLVVRTWSDAWSHNFTRKSATWVLFSSAATRKV